MHSDLHTIRQQAHDVVDRLNSVQVSALISLFEPLARTQPRLFRAPFCDELPIDAEETMARRPVASVKRNFARTSAA